MPRAFTGHEKELISRRLLEEGSRLFSAHGLRKTNVEEIAQAAGISKGAFYIFYESKEALCMDVIELAEKRFRMDVLAVIDVPGPSSRARLFAVLKKAFSLLTTMPLSQFFTGSDYDLLFRRVPAATFQEHLASDQAFFAELITRCRNAGILIQAQPEEISGLLYPLAMTILHADEFRASNFGGSVDMYLELIAAFCLGEVEIQARKPIDSASQPLEGGPQ